MADDLAADFHKVAGIGRKITIEISKLELESR